MPRKQCERLKDISAGGFARSSGRHIHPNRCFKLAPREVADDAQKTSVSSSAAALRDPGPPWCWREYGDRGLMSWSSARPHSCFSLSAGGEAQASAAVPESKQGVSTTRCACTSKIGQALLEGQGEGSARTLTPPSRRLIPGDEFTESVSEAKLLGPGRRASTSATWLTRNFATLRRYLRRPSLEVLNCAPPPRLRKACWRVQTLREHGTPTTCEGAGRCAHRLLFQKAALEAASDNPERASTGASYENLGPAELKNALRSGDIWVKARGPVPPTSTTTCLPAERFAAQAMRRLCPWRSTRTATSTWERAAGSC